MAEEVGLSRLQKPSGAVQTPTSQFVNEMDGIMQINAEINPETPWRVQTRRQQSSSRGHSMSKLMVTTVID